MIVLAGTGHRPEDCEHEDVIRDRIRQALLELAPDEVITGMAAGFDLYLGGEAIDMGIPTTAARPWAGHTHRRGDESEYARIIEGASRVVNVVNQVPYPGVYVYHKRDKWMIDNCTHVLAYLNPLATKGGTYGTVQYALKQQRPIRYIYGNQI